MTTTTLAITTMKTISKPRASRRTVLPLFRSMTSVTVLLLWMVLLSSILVSMTMALSTTTEFLFNVAQSSIRAASGSTDLFMPPQGSKSQLPKHMHASFILLPGALVRPDQYREVALSIQSQSELALWIAIPSITPVSNPLTVGVSVKNAFDTIQRLGYPGNTTFVGGHSLGGAFLPNIFDNNQMSTRHIEGLIHLGCILSRQGKDDTRINQLPHMVLVGDLDGLVRTSRVAEDYYRYVLNRNNQRTDDIIIKGSPIENDNTNTAAAAAAAADIDDDVDNTNNNNKRNNSDGTDLDYAKLQHCVVLIRGMNHFGYISGRPPFMDDFRDLRGEISRTDAIQQVGSSVAQFIDYHHHNHRQSRRHRRFNGDDRNDVDVVRDGPKTALLTKIDRTIEYIQPLLTAMQLEGSYHIGPPCHLCEEEGVNCDGGCVEGSPWAAMVQQDLAPEGITYTPVKDEFRQSWWINPFADPPFYHPSVAVAGEEDGAGIQNDNTVIPRMKIGMGPSVPSVADGLLSSPVSTTSSTISSTAPVLAMETVSEAVYEKADFYLFDAGFFSNAAIEIRSKFNSRQSIMKAAGTDIPHQSECGACSAINDRTIQWAIQNAPPDVQRRYQNQGTKLVVGKDIEHTSGPEWIWSYLEYKRTDDRTIELQSHTMSTPMDNPVPFAGGKLYCKLLSPLKALDWMYTDCLRPPTEGSRLYNEVLLSPANFLKFVTDETQKQVKDVVDPFFLPKSFIKTGIQGMKVVTELAELVQKEERRNRER